MLNFSQNKVLYYISIFNWVGLGTWRNAGYTSVHLSDTNIKVGPRSKSTPPKIFLMCAPAYNVSLVIEYWIIIRTCVYRLIRSKRLRCLERVVYSWIWELSQQLNVPFVIYADFEAIVTPVDSETRPNNIGSYTTKYQKHTDCGYGYKLVCCYDSRYSKPVKVFRGKGAVNRFLNCMLEEI